MKASTFPTFSIALISARFGSRRSSDFSARTSVASLSREIRPQLAEARTINPPRSEITLEKWVDIARFVLVSADVTINLRRPSRFSASVRLTNRERSLALGKNIDHEVAATSNSCENSPRGDTTLRQLANFKAPSALIFLPFPTDTGNAVYLSCVRPCNP